MMDWEQECPTEGSIATSFASRQLAGGMETASLLSRFSTGARLAAGVQTSLLPPAWIKQQRKTDKLTFVLQQSDNG
jgi:hypothetical protein